MLPGKKISIQNGQAMVEFIITATFILVPLFLIVPLFSKYVDIQQSTIQAARYEVWEYTAWFSQSSDVSSSFNVTSVIEATKTTSEVQNESRQRFFSNTNLKLSGDDKLGWAAGNKNLMWRDHQNNTLYDGSVDGILDYSADTPDLTANLFGGSGAISILSKVIEGIPAFLSSVLSAGTLEPGFTAMNSGGYNKSLVQISVLNAPDYTNMNSSDPLFEKDLNLVLSAQAAVLSDGWNAGGGEHAKTEEEGLVPTILLRKPFDFVVDILDYIPFIPASELDSLEWGHTDSEAIPPEYLEDYNAHSNAIKCDAGGYCSYPVF